MKILKMISTWFIDSGVTKETPALDIKYVRFLNATLLLLFTAQIPMLGLMIGLASWTPLLLNLAATGVCWLGFMLNRRGNHLTAKMLVLTIMIANSTHPAFVMGSSAPAHLWLIPAAVLGVLVFKPSERLHMAAFVGITLVVFTYLEFVYRDLEPIVLQMETAEVTQQLAYLSTICAIFLTLVLIGLMHRRFADSETSLSQEKAQSERLLRAILPETVAQELRDTGTTQAVRHEDVSILFADLVGFTPLAASMPAEDVVTLLATIFERFDSLITDCGVEKIKTIGDAYMVAGGVPEPTPEHAKDLARCAFGMLEIIEDFSQNSGHQLQLRIGLHRGPAVAGVIGTTKFAYDLWGETVNLASRLESSGEPGRIHISDTFKAGIGDSMTCDERGEITIKGVGLTRTHWLVGHNS
mgnify:CR=1 FL=1